MKAPGTKTTRSVDQEYAAQADTYDARWQRYLEISTAHTLAALEPRDGEYILDAGCGTGRLLRRIGSRAPGAHLFGTDLTPPMIRQADASRTNLAVADIRALPLADESLDAVVIASVLQYLPEIDRALSEAVRVLRPGGRLVITAWNGSSWRMHMLSQWLRCRGQAEVHLHQRHDLVASCRNHGLEVRQQQCYAIGHIWRLLTLVGIKTNRVAGTA